MKRLLLVVTGIFFLSLSALCHADVDPKHPCVPIKKACEAAGFQKGQKNGKALFKDCLKPILAGQTVAGVTVDPDVLAACKAKRAAEHK